MSRPRLEQLSIGGFKTFRALADFAPGDLTVLIGPNGAGKSNLISFFRLLSWMTASPGQLQTHIAQLGGASAVLHQGAVPADELRARLLLTTDKGRNEYGFGLLPAAEDSLVFAEEWFSFRKSGQTRPPPGLGRGHRESRLAEMAEMAEKGNTTARVMLGMLGRVVVQQFHNTAANARLRNKCAVEDGRWLKEDAGNLAAFLFRIQQQQPPYYRRIVETIRLVLPFLADFELEPEYDFLLLRWRELGSDHVFNASQAADGMLRVMALVALLQQPEADLPHLLILDEPELGLHPSAIELLAGLIKAASTHVQVMVATQSVSLIDRVAPEDVVVVERRGGESVLHRLGEAELGSWLDDYTLSELWEKNVLGGRPGLVGRGG